MRRTVVSVITTTVALTVAALLVLGTAGPAAASTNAYEKQILVATNKYRVAHDRVALKKRACATAYAERQARRMAAAKTMYHQKLGPILKKCGYSAVGENVAAGQDDGTDAVRAWIHSSGHRKNMLTKKWRHIGIGSYHDSNGRWYYCQVFAAS